MNFLWFYISKDDSDIWGSIIGAAATTVGALFIAFVAAWLARRVERKKRIDGDLDGYHRALLTAETTVQTQIPMLHRNTGILEECAKELDTDSMLANLPSLIVLDKDTSHDFYNAELINHWLTLWIHVEMLNQSIIDFRKYYTRSYQLWQSVALLGQPVKLNIIKHERKMLQTTALSLKKQTDVVIEKFMEMNARIAVHGKNKSDEKTRFKSVDIIRKYEMPNEKYLVELENTQKAFAAENVLGPE